MRFIKTEEGCFVCISHKPIKDGYLYKGWTIDGAKETEAFHRFILRAHDGLLVIPDRHEVDHICGNRGCCNRKHLRLIERSDHKRVTNMLRYADRQERARCHWEAHRHSRKVTGAELSRAFGVSPTTGKQWIKKWNAEAPLAA